MAPQTLFRPTGSVAAAFSSASTRSSVRGVMTPSWVTFGRSMSPRNSEQGTATLLGTRTRWTARSRIHPVPASGSTWLLCMASGGRESWLRVECPLRVTCDDILSMLDRTMAYAEDFVTIRDQHLRKRHFVAAFPELGARRADQSNAGIGLCGSTHRKQECGGGRRPRSHVALQALHRGAMETTPGRQDALP
jgi:hypothetical protein